MNTPSAVSTGLGCLLLCTGVLSVTPGCADSEPFPDVDGPGATEGPVPVALPNGGHVIDEYVLQVSPRSHTTKLVHLKPGVSSRPGFKPQSVDTINVVQNGVAGMGPVNSVELDTDQNSIKYGATCPTGIVKEFCGTVTLGNFYTRSLNNVFVQATSITDVNGNNLTGHSGINSDTAPIWLADSGLGLWKYTGSSNTTAGVVGVSPNNFGSRVWEFADPDGADTYITLRVVASLSYSNYTRTNITTAYVNSCTQVSDNSINGSDAAVTIPFGFTFWALQSTTSSLFNRNGVLTVGGVTPPAAFDNSTFKSVALPDNTIPHVSSTPGIYVFWDKLNYNASSNICHGVFGSAPNRTFVYTWRSMKGFGNTANTMIINFNVVLTEGTDTIDMVYGPMSGAAGNDQTTFPTTPTTITNAQRAAGKKAIIGVQGPSGAVNISEPTSAALGSTAITLSSLNTNMAFRYTPVP